MTLCDGAPCTCTRYSGVEYRLEHKPASAQADRWLGPGRDGLVYEMCRHEQRIWSVGIDFGEARQNPFREEFYYFEAGVLAIGGGDTVYFFRLLDGTPQKEVAVPEHFGHLDIVSRESGEPNELFLVLSWTGVEALDRTLSRVWVTEHIAVDGVCGGCVIDGAIVVHAEMDPPGGWFEVELDFSTGKELHRKPAFLPGYLNSS